MPALATLLLLTTFATPPTTLVLHSGERLEVEGAVREQNGRVIFRAGRLLYSVAADEVDVEATRIASQPDPKPKDGAVRKLKVSEEERKRLIAELQKNHIGLPPAPEQLGLPDPPTPKSKGDVERERNDEWAWRRQARGYEESVRQARENLAMLEQRVEQLRGDIAGFLNLGYKPSQFSHQTTQLHRTLDQIPGAQLAIARAERAYEQFREDARKQGVTPGWLR
jgi:hypothetical protein